jgi:hypothetical protein
MKRTLRLYWDELLVAYDHKDLGPHRPILLDRAKVPHGAAVRVFELLVRDVERSFGRWCSPEVQATADIVAYKVEIDLPDNVEQDDEAREEALTWADDLASTLFAESAGVRHSHYDINYFDDVPYVEREVEIDDEDLEDLDENTIEQKLEDAFLELTYEVERPADRPTAEPAEPAAPAAAKE